MRLKISAGARSKGGAVSQVLSVWRPDPGSADGVAPDESLPRLSAESAARVADYLDAGAVVARTTMRLPDAWSGSSRPVVGLTKRTDGRWRWDDAVAYYVRRYGLSPGGEFLRYLQDRDYQVPQVSAAEVSAVIDEIFGAADAVPEDHEIRVDGSQLLQSAYYARYEGRVFRCEFELSDVVLKVEPGQVIPDGFEARQHRESRDRSIAVKRVPVTDVEAIRRVITTCQYKGTPFSIRRIDGPRFVVSIGGGRRIKPSQEPPRPSMDEWGQFPNVEVLGLDDLWADLDVVEAAQVTMAVVPYQLVDGRLRPVHDPTGYAVAVPAADEIFYFPSPESSPFLPQAEAVAAFRAYLDQHNPAYPAAAVTPLRLRDGWLMNPSASVQKVYCVADDAVVLAASAAAPVNQVSSHLSAQFHQRHPIAEAAPADDSGTEYFD